VVVQPGTVIWGDVSIFQVATVSENKLYPLSFRFPGAPVRDHMVLGARVTTLGGHEGITVGRRSFIGTNVEFLLPADECGFLADLLVKRVSSRPAVGYKHPDGGGGQV
jgi:hypothetical protein